MANNANAMSVLFDAQLLTSKVCVCVHDCGLLCKSCKSVHMFSHVILAARTIYHRNLSLERSLHCCVALKANYML